MIIDKKSQHNNNEKQIIKRVLSKKVDEKFLTNYKNVIKISKKGGAKYIKKINSIQEWIPIDYFLENGIIKLKNNNYIKIIKIEPINFNLKSELEKESILNSYKIFLKTCDFNFQILIQSNKEDLSKNISNIKNNINNRKERYLKKIADEYIRYIKSINLNVKSSSKNFYIIVPRKANIQENEDIIIEELNEKYFKIKECLSRCGNFVTSYSTKKELIQVFNSFFNPNNYLYKK